MTKPKIVSCHSGKGGVGKTSVVANLGAVLAERGHSTLLIDSDFFTHGLTFLLAGEISRFKTTYQDLIEQLAHKADPKTEPATPPSLDKFHQVGGFEKLHLLPPKQMSDRGKRGDRSQWTTVGRAEAKKTLVMLAKVSRLSPESIKDYLSGFEFVLIDCRSGTDPASTAPASIADEYWVVTEEDNTSIRASNFLLNSIAEQFESDAKELNFGGFIINMSVTPKQDMLSTSLARRFSGKCLSVVNLSYNAREAFIHDQLVVHTKPQDFFSREMQALADYISGEHTAKTSIQRLLTYVMEQRIRTFGMALTGLLALVALMYLRTPFSTERLGADLIGLFVAALGATVGSLLIYLLYAQGRR